MKRSLHLFMLRGGVFICIVTLLLTSCENFLKAGEIKAEIEESIEIANSKPILYHIIADKDSGTVSPSQATLKKKQSVNLLFTPAEGCTFIRWEVRDRSSGELVPDAIKFDNPKDPETKALIVRPRENLMICPKCTLVPAVIQITPAFESGGCDQDTAIEIIFNKAVDTLTFDFDNISITSAEGTELFSTDPDYSFFDMPYFSEDNKVLTIPTIKGKFLLLPDGVDEGTTAFNSKKNRDDITVYLDLYGVKDCDGLDFMQCDFHTYRVNKTVDNVPPVITDIHLYSTSDTSDYFYKELTDKQFYNWSRTIEKNPDGTTLYLNGDYSRNHVNQLYITLSGYDKDSGLSKIAVKESYKKDTNGTNVSGGQEARTTIYSIPDDVIVEQKDDGTIVYAIEYQFDNDNVLDGLYTVDVSFLDRTNNESIAKEYWVIRDSTGNYTCDIQTGTSNCYPVTNNEANIQFINFTINSDTFYKVSSNALKSQRVFSLEYCESDKANLNNFDGQIISVFDGYDMGSSTSLKELVNNALQNTKRNVRKYTKFTVRIEEESGLVFEFPVVIPKSVDVVNFPTSNTGSISNAGLIRFTKPAENIEGFDYQYYTTYFPVYTYQASEEDSPGEYVFVDQFPSLFTGEFIQSVLLNQDKSEKPDGIYTIYMVCRYSVSGKFDIFTSIGKPLKSYKGITNTHTSNSISWPDVVLPVYSAGQIFYVPNKGTAKFSIGLNYGENVNMNYSYYVRVGVTYATDSLDFEVGSRREYDVYLMAIDSGSIVASKKLSEKLSLYDELNCPPEYWRFIYGKNNIEKNYIEPNAIRCRYISPDGNYDDNDKKISKAEFYFVPEELPSLTIDEIKRYKKNVVEILPADITNGYVEYAYDDLPDGTYDIYVICYNEAGNTTLGDEVGSTVKHYVADYKPSFEAQSSGIKISSVSFTSNMCPAYKKGNISNFANLVSIRYLENEDWKDSDVIHSDMVRDESSGNWNYDIPYTSFSDTFIKICANFSVGDDYNSYIPIFMKPEYIYTGYYKYLADYEADNPGQTAPAYCKSKTWMPVANGWQIFADRPAFVHTLYCSKNLTQTGNFTTAEAALEWETRAQETGIVYNDGTGITFSYTDENLAGIPEDYYYTTICHFADGTVVMSEVKQKE